MSEAKKILFQLLERGSSITHLCVEKRAALLRSRELLACLHSYFFTRLTKRNQNPYLHEGRDLKVVFIAFAWIKSFFSLHSLEAISSDHISYMSK